MVATRRLYCCTCAVVDRSGRGTPQRNVRALGYSSQTAEIHCASGVICSVSLNAVQRTATHTSHVLLHIRIASLHTLASGTPQVAARPSCCFPSERLRYHQTRGRTTCTSGLSRVRRA